MAGRIVQPRTSTQITIESQTLCPTCPRPQRGASTKRWVFCRVCFLFSHILLTEVFADCVSEDNDKDDDNDNKEEENDNKDTNHEDEDDSNKDNKNKYDENRSINNDDNKDNIMPPKLK